ncbi:MAG: prolipoprotein diacylglyceryl transferase [Dehalococcoidia bacterium]
MLSALALLTINIGIDPEIQEFGDLLLTWHGVFTAVGIAAGVYVAVLVARRLGFIDDDVYSVALIAIPSGIVGARALFVAENWGESGLDSVVDIFRINEGGISIYGAVLGGIAGGLVYGWLRKIPLRRGLDVAAFGAILGMAIGRIGDLINGEHFSEVSSLPWAVRYTNLNSPSVLGHPQCGIDPLFGIDTSQLCAQHPAVGYEMVGDLLIFGLLFLILRMIQKDGVIFFSFILLYSLMRFGVSELRLDSEDVFAGLSTPQVTALGLIPIALAGLWYCFRQPDRDLRPVAQQATSPPARGVARASPG